MSVIRTKIDFRKPAVVLLLIGGSLILSGGILSLALNSMWAFMNTGMMNQGMMMGNMMDGQMMWMMNNQFWSGMMTTISIVGISSGVLVIVAGIMINQKSSIEMWAVVALVFSTIAFLNTGGFVIGSILGILGGILSLFLKK